MSSAPLQVEGLRVAGRTMDTITLAWTASAGARSYKVQCGSSGWVGVSWGQPLDARKATAYTVKGLTGSTTYYFRVIPCGEIDGPATDGTLHASTLSQEEDYNRLKTENKELAARADGHTEHRTMATKIDEMMTRVAAAEAEVQSKNTEMKAMSGKLQACKRELQEYEARCKAAEESSVQDLQDQLATATAARDAALEQLEQLGQDAAEARKELEQAQEKIARHLASLAAAEEEKQVLKAQLVRKEESVTQLTSQVVTLNSRLDSARGEVGAASGEFQEKIERFRQEKEKLAENLMARTSETAALRESLVAAEAQATMSHNELAATVTELEAKISALTDSLSQSEAQQAESMLEVSKLQGKIQTLEDTVAAKDADIAELRSALSACQAQLSELEAQATDTNSKRGEEIERLTQQLAASKEALDAAEASLCASDESVQALTASLQTSQDQITELRMQIAKQEAAHAEAVGQGAVATEAAVRSAVERCEEEAKSTLAKAMAELREALQQCDDHKSALAKATNELHEAQAAAEEHKQSATAATEAAHGQVAKYRDMVTASSRKVTTLSAQVENLEHQNTTLSGEVARMSRQRDNCIKDMGTAKRDVEIATRKCEVLSTKANSAEARAAELERRCAELAEELHRSQTSNAAGVRQLETDKSALMAENLSLRDQLEVLKAKVASVPAQPDNSRLNELHARLSESERKVLSLQSELVTADAKVHEAEAAVAAMTSDKVHLENLGATLQTTIESQQKQLQTVTEECKLQLHRVQHVEEANNRIEETNHALTLRVAELEEALGRIPAPAPAPAAPSLRRQSKSLFRDMGLTSSQLKQSMKSLAYYVDELGYPEERAREAIMKHRDDRNKQLQFLMDDAGH